MAKITETSGELGSVMMRGIIPKSQAKGTDICTNKKYYYIIRSDLGCYMQTSDLHKGADISIFSLHPACQNGDHYIGGGEDGYFHIIKGTSCRRVTDLSTDNNAVVYNLHPSCQGGDHYLRSCKCFYIIFQEKGTLRVTTDMELDSDAKVHTLDPNFRDGLYYWGLLPQDILNIVLFKSAMFRPFDVISCLFSFLKPASEWSVEFCHAPDLTIKKQTAVCSVHPDVLNFLPGGLSVTKGPATGMWENIKTITNDSNTPMTWQKKITKKVGYNKEKMTQMTHNWKIAASASFESGALSALIAKIQLSFSIEYGGSRVNTENESWNEATEEEELLSFELKPKESVYVWQYKLGLGQEPVLFCHDLKITNEPNCPTEVPLPPAQP